MRIIRSAVLLLCLLTSNAYAVVAGGMVAVDRQWPSSDVGFLDVEFAITIAQEPGRDGFTFWADQFWFKGGDGAYIGLQQRDGRNKALNFSIWKATGWVPEKGANCAFFDHENSGVQCWIDYGWKPRTKYRIQVVAEELGHWTAYITDTDSGKRRKVATIQVPSTWGGIYDSSSFVEDYAQGGDERGSCAEVPATSAVFHQPQAENGTVLPTSSNARIYGVCATIARASCTLEQECIASANVYGNLGDPKSLLHEASGQCLEARAGAGAAGLDHCTASSAQLFERDDHFRMSMQAQNQCLQVGEDGSVQAGDCVESSMQRWIPVADSNALYHVGSGLCLAPVKSDKAASVRLQTCDGKRLQRWRMIP